MTDLFEAEAITTTSLDLRRLQRQERRATRRKWTVVISAVSLVILAIGASTAWNFVQATFATDENFVADYEGLGTGSVTVVVNPGDTGADIATTLFEAGVVASEQAYINAANADQAAAATIKPGHYFMAREMKAEFAFLYLLDSDRRDVRKITVPEGHTLGYYYQKIADLTGFTLEEVEAAAAEHDVIGLPAEANGNLEGWLFPQTYQFNPGVTPTDVLSAMIAQTVDVLDDRGVAPADRQRILTIASLIEREARLDEDRPMISGVIYNRLDIGMKLQLDATIKYFKPSEGPFVSADDKLIDNPYNTYYYEGLPPAPISGAGVKSIEAAITPSVHDYVFYVTVDLSTGETRYATTYSEHLANVEILNTWYAANGG
jgi:UPF0755 protein